jgi:hypothetical protein
LDYDTLPTSRARAEILKVEIIFRFSVLVS